VGFAVSVGTLNGVLKIKFNENSRKAILNLELHRLWTLFLNILFYNTVWDQVFWPLALGFSVAELNLYIKRNIPGKF
jgi:hypothetical protein